MPGTPKITPMVPGAPGHGEGHNSGMPLIVAAAIAAKDVMIKNNIKGRLMIWPGVAEELLATKAYYVREGLFKDVDASIFTHVGNRFGTGYGEMGNNGMVSVEYSFHGKTSHAAGAPWAGRSALDAVEVMDMAWNMRREHLPLTQRSHYVITNGGGQPNVVPGEASVWYYFREQTFDLDPQAVRDGQHHLRSSGDGDRHHGHAARARLCRAQFRQQADGRGRLCQHQGGRHAEMEPPTTRPSPRRCRRPMA